MLDRLYEEINKLLTKKKKYISSSVVETNLIPLFILKYLCDEGIYSYKEIIKLDNLDNIEIKFDDRRILFGDSSINKLLPLIEYEDITSLVKEYLGSLKIGINFVNSENKKICITTEYDNNLYDIMGNTTYVINKFSYVTQRILWFKFFDKVLKVNNDYVRYEELDINKYNMLYIQDFLPKYRFIRNSNNDIYDLIRTVLSKNMNMNIILHTNYKKISNMNEGWYLLRSLDKVILYDDYNTFLFFKVKKDEIVSIINYENVKNKSLEKLYDIITKNRRQKDILTKTTISEIKNNHYRIGFKLYQDKLAPDVSNINDIVVENTRLIEKLSDLNTRIEQEINKLINR